MRHRLRCSEVWGGIRDEDVDACSATVDASLVSIACDGGGKGGDIYYFSVCDGDQLTRIALADVAGHGRAVSRVSEWLFEAMARAMNTLDGDRVLNDLNGAATKRGIDALATAAVAGFYRANATLYLAYAGHHPALLLRRGQARWQPVRNDAFEDVVRVLDRHDDDEVVAAPANLPLGVLPDVAYEHWPTQLGPGDRLVMYTDGVIEAPAADGGLFGVERLRAVLDEHAVAGLRETKHAVVDAVRRWTGGSLAHDDVTLLVVELR